MRFRNIVDACIFGGAALGIILMMYRMATGTHPGDPIVLFPATEEASP